VQTWDIEPLVATRFLASFLLARLSIPRVHAVDERAQRRMSRVSQPVATLGELHRVDPRAKARTPR
jgi:hypothetical protein